MSKNNVRVESIPEVQRYLEAEDRINNLKSEYPGVFDELKELVDARNAALEEAEKVVRARKVSCGPFTILSESTKYDAQAFFDAVGRDDFLKLGGTIETIPTYTVDKKRVEAAITQGLIPVAVLPAFVSQGISYSVPKKIIVP